MATTTTPSLSASAAFVRRLMLRTSAGPLRLVWGSSYRLCARAAAGYLRRGQPGCAVYAFGEPAGPDVVYGVSDLDLAVVIPPRDGQPGELREQILSRWERLCRTLPVLRSLIGLAVYETSDLERGSASVPSRRFVASLDSPTGSAILPPSSFAKPPDSVLRAGFGLPREEWKRLAGRDRLPATLTENHDPRIAAWLELQHWWRHAFVACLDPTGPHAPFLCVKLAAESARIWIWLTHGERVATRREALERALELIPEEAEAFERALELRRTLHRSPSAPVAESLAAFRRLSGKIARLLAEQATAKGVTEVALEWGGPEELAVLHGAKEPGHGALAHARRLLPLADWRSLAYPGRALDEAFELVSADPADPSVIASLARRSQRGPYAALLGDGLLVLPAPSARRAKLRAVQCRLSDPSSFALAEGSKVAAFPNLGGWSIQAMAVRAVAEHRASLARDRMTTEPSKDLATLLSCARASLLLESLEAGSPQLPLTLRATASSLAHRYPLSRDVAEESWGSYAAWRKTDVEPPATLPEHLREAVVQLPAYRGFPTRDTS